MKKWVAQQMKKHEIKEQLAEMYGSLCYYCGTERPLDELTVDHVHPRSKGGPLTLGNTVLACKGCNLEKGSRQISMEEFKYEKRPHLRGNDHPPDVIRSKKKGIGKSLSKKPIKERIRGPEELVIIARAKPKTRVQKFFDWLKS